MLTSSIFLSFFKIKSRYSATKRVAVKGFTTPDGGRKVVLACQYYTLKNFEFFFFGYRGYIE
jgi:hypothetical protein